MLTGGAALIKYLLFVFNLVFVITGIVILTIGAVILAEYGTYEGLLDGNYYSTPGLLISIGVIIFLVAFFGCCGSIKENYCMVLTFAVLMIAIFILEVAGGMAGYMLSSKAEPLLKKNMMEMLPQYNSTTGPWNREDWDSLQKNFKCCGVESPADWMTHTALFNETFRYPLSCCSLDDPKKCSLDAPPSNATGIYKDGCLMSLEKFVSDNAITIGGTGIGIAVIQLIGVVLTCTLAKNIKQGYETV
ncbi:CD63 antigen-like [Cloeon dipterum]|uniref:CD63 antigen-like n=1 Tax=Cloeon dipterum TaxID=197152 RepID=UPI00321FD0E1